VLSTELERKRNKFMVCMIQLAVLVAVTLARRCKFGAPARVLNAHRATEFRYGTIT
jgi:hypothetical protein